MFCQVNLETDVIDDLICFFWRVVNAAGNRNDGDEVNEGSTALSIIYHTCLAFLVRDEGVAEMSYGVWSSVLSWFTSLNAAMRGLEKAAICADNFLL